MSPPPSTRGKALIKINAFIQGVLIKHLLEGEYNCQELADITGLHYVTVQQYCRELHRAGAAFINRWEKDTRGRDAVKVYKVGIGKDAKREKLTGAQRQARVRDRKLAAQRNAVVAGRGQYVQARNGRLRFEELNHG